MIAALPEAGKAAVETTAIETSPSFTMAVEVVYLVKMQFAMLTSCDWNGAPAQVASPGANRLNVTVPVGALLLVSVTRPRMVAVSDRLSGGTPFGPNVPPAPGVVVRSGKDTPAEPEPPPGAPFTASVASAPASTATCSPLSPGLAAIAGVEF